MSRSPNRKEFPRIVRPRLGLILSILLILCGGIGAQPTAPTWWVGRGVVDPQKSPNDYAILNLGQLKTIAAKARDELNAILPPASGETTGAGSVIENMITTWQTNTANADDFAAANLGQLKTVAKPFWDRLVAAQRIDEYPWTGAGQDDFALTNLGQLKTVFNFDGDMDDDGVDDTWELANGFSAKNPDDAAEDADGDGVSNLDEYSNGTDPQDFYNGAGPVLTLLSGNNQTAFKSVFLPQPLVVRVHNANSDPMANVPLLFTATAGALLGSSSGSGSPLTESIEVRTLGDGSATVYCKTPPVVGEFSVDVRGMAPGAVLLKTFHEIVVGDPSQPAAAPSGLVERWIDAKTMEWTWQDNSDNETEFIIERKNPSGQWVEIGRVGPNVTKFRYTQPD